jgi:hypothetical protein
MSRSVRGSKSCGYEYWGKRALSCCSPGRISKKITLSMERTAERKLIHDEVQSANSEDNTPCEEEVS